MSKVSVVTAGTSGIGKAIVEKLLLESKDADDVIIVNYGHSEEKAKELADSLNETDSKKVKLIKADLSDYEAMIAFTKEVLAVSDTIDNLILNAGIGTYEKFDDYTYELWTKVINTNLSIPVFMVKELKPHMSEKGKIVFIGSMMGRIPHSTSLAYGVSKAGVHFLTQALLKEFDGTGVTLNCIAPGFIETPWHSARTQESYDRINKKIALHRFGESSEVADLCYSVLTNDYINGNVIDINGGYNYF